MNTRTKIVLFSVIGIALVCVLVFGFSGTPSGQGAATPCTNHAQCSQAYSASCPRGQYGCCVNGQLGQCRAGKCTYVDLSESYCKASLDCEFGEYYDGIIKRCRAGADPAAAKCTNHAQCSSICPDSECAEGVYGCCTGKDLGQCNVATGYCYCSKDVALCGGGVGGGGGTGNCTDTDGGKVYGVAGNITNSTGTHPDACYKDTYGPSGWAGEKLAEGACDEARHSITYDCASEGKTCQNGRCVAAGNCNDTDGGWNYAERGTVRAANGSMYTDSCYSGTMLGEYYCNASNPNDINHLNTNCASFGIGQVCQNGACVFPGGSGGNVSGCTDSDGGLNYAKGGTVVSSNGTTRTDYGCYGTGSAHTSEWACNASAPGVPAYFAVNCASYGLACVNKACV